MNFLGFIQLFGMTALSIICFIMCLFCLIKLHNLSSAISENNESQKKIEEYLNKLKNTPASSAAVYAQKGALCKVAVVHFNAFPDVTGAVSFAAALLDEDNNGIILTSIYGHDSSNTYIREVFGGDCKTHLLEEELKALTNAINKK